MNPISLKEMRFKCQQSGHCCCDPNIIVTLTFRDIHRLFLALEKNYQLLLQKISFYTLGESTSTITKQQMVLEPIHIDRGNVIPGLRKYQQESCVFYTPPNCSAYSQRPLACRNYPMTFIEEKDHFVSTWVKNSKKNCPGIGKGSQISLKFIDQQGTLMFKEIKEHNQVVREINIEASKGHPLTAREVLWILITYGEKNF